MSVEVSACEVSVLKVMEVVESIVERHVRGWGTTDAIIFVQ